MSKQRVRPGAVSVLSGFPEPLPVSSHPCLSVLTQVRGSESHGGETFQREGGEVRLARVGQRARLSHRLSRMPPQGAVQLVPTLMSREQPSFSGRDVCHFRGLGFRSETEQDPPDKAVDLGEGDTCA